MTGTSTPSDVKVLVLGHEVFARDVQRGHAEQLAFVVDTGVLKHGLPDGHSAVDWVGDDCVYSVRAVLGCAAASVALMDPLVLNRSSRVMPGLRGTPAGTTTTSHPFRASPSWSSP